MSESRNACGVLRGCSCMHCFSALPVGLFMCLATGASGVSLVISASDSVATLKAQIVAEFPRGPNGEVFDAERLRLRLMGAGGRLGNVLLGERRTAPRLSHTVLPPLHRSVGKQVAPSLRLAAVYLQMDVASRKPSSRRASSAMA
eukprot:COSAG01_NODE_2740_length_7158_cov_3.142371_4_plen_145_part_00